MARPKRPAEAQHARTVPRILHYEMLDADGTSPSDGITGFGRPIYQRSVAGWNWSAPADPDDRDPC